MPTIAQLNGGVAATAVTDDDVFVGNDGSTAKKFPATVLKTYILAQVLADISDMRMDDLQHSTDIATNTSGLATLNTTVSNLVISVSNVRTASYTFALSDASLPLVTVVMNVATANTLTIPPNSSVAFPVGSILCAEQWGVGLTTWTAGAGVTIRSRGSVLAMAGQWAAASARKIAADEWLLFGDIS